MRITSIERPPRRRTFEVRVDHVMLLRLSPEVLALSGLATGEEVDNDRLRAIEEQEARHAALAYAMRLLAYRPRAEAELARKLSRKGFAEAICRETLARLKELKLVDDAAYARSFVDTRTRTSPRSRRLLASELRGQRVPAGSVEAAVAEVDEAQAAYQAAAKRARNLTEAAFPDFKRRIADLLLRRGFDYDTARATVARLWEETRGTRPGAEEMEE